MCGAMQLTKLQTQEATGVAPSGYRGTQCCLLPSFVCSKRSITCGKLGSIVQWFQIDQPLLEKYPESLHSILPMTGKTVF